MKERVVVICPGRGTYTRESLGYLNRHRPRFDQFISDLDDARRALGQPTLTDLDQAATFAPGVHTRGEHASALIYACAYADFMALDRERYDVVAVTGNSMGWYVALACSGALDPRRAFAVINTMGSMMKERIVGGQLIYPIVDDEWRRKPELENLVEQAIADANACDGSEAHLSIRLGGYVVIGGNQPGLDHVLRALPKNQQYPFQLINHAAFHTPLLAETSRRAFDTLGADLFETPSLPVIDGRGHIWREYSTDPDELYRYTFGDQVVTPYDFTAAVTVALREFCPDRLILLGPGDTLGGAIGQILIETRWHGLSRKAEFSRRQQDDPFLISLGRSPAAASLASA
jgi:[acyl-carrier-protein] S-malonyltransferase